jgi:hypothetical protein
VTDLATVISTPSGKKSFTGTELAAMSPTNQATLTAGIQAAVNANPGLDVKIADNLSGGIDIVWRTR